MSIGLGIFLFVAGAILVWAVEVQLDWIDLDMVGYILMGAGFLVFVLGIVLLARRRTSSTVSATHVDPATGDRVTRNESRGPDPL